MLRHLMTSEICKCKILKFDFLENEKSFRSELENIFPNLTSAFFRLKKQNSTRVDDTNFLKNYLEKTAPQQKCFNRMPKAKVNLHFERLIDRSSRRKCSVRKGVLSNFTKFTGKHLCQSLFFNKVAPQ